jgi:hypothetical protein
MLDRKRYVDENGVSTSDADMVTMLNEVWHTITENGIKKIEPGKQQGKGMRANRGTEHRVLHFKDAEAYLTYGAAYNKGGILSAMQSHVARLAKDIALVEEFGPNPNVQFQFMHDTAKETGSSDLVGPFLVRTTDMWNVLNGQSGTVANPKLAAFAQGWRNIEVFGKLGSAFISSITDIPTYFATTGYNKLGFSESLVNLIKAFGSEHTEYANRAGLVAESIISDMNRWAESNIGHGWTAKLANATMKASLLEGWTDALRRGYSITMMGALGKLSRLDWNTLNIADRARLEAKGVTADDFAIWKLSTPERWNNSDMLSVDAIRAIDPATLQAHGYTARDINRAVTKLLGAVVDESEYASINQDLQTRAAVVRSTIKGTVEGEFLRSFMLFKGFPFAMVSRHWGRVVDQWRNGEKVSSVAYGAGLTTALTIFGGLVIELKDLLAGKDPRPLNTWAFWGAAFAQGGGVGIFGDLLYTGLGGQNRAGVPNWMGFFGPVIGSAMEGVNLTAGNIGEAARGKETHAGAEAVRFAKSHLPFVNMWYAKSAIDHAGLQDLQEMLSPGYLGRMRQRANTDWGQDFWWEPGTGMPQRAPDLNNAFKQ